MEEFGFDASLGAPADAIGAVAAWLVTTPEGAELAGTWIEGQDVCRERQLLRAGPDPGRAARPTVPRPAPAAWRAVQILELLTTHAVDSFSLSEIARRLSLNVASTHTVLAVLEEAGYVVRHPTRKTYGLGPSLVAAGDAALRRYPAIDAARRDPPAERRARHGADDHGGRRHLHRRPGPGRATPPPGPRGRRQRPLRPAPGLGLRGLAAGRGDHGLAGPGPAGGRPGGPGPLPGGGPGGPPAGLLRGRRRAPARRAGRLHRPRARRPGQGGGPPGGGARRPRLPPSRRPGADHGGRPGLRRRRPGRPGHRPPRAARAPQCVRAPGLGHPHPRRRPGGDGRARGRVPDGRPPDPAAA